MDLKKIALGAGLWAVGVVMALWKQAMLVSLMNSDTPFSVANASMKPVDGFVGLFVIVMWVIGMILMVSGLRAKTAR